MNNNDAGAYDDNRPEGGDGGSEDEASIVDVVDLDLVRDSVVADSTMNSYIGDILGFFLWCRFNFPDWLTDMCKVELDAFIRQEDESARLHRSRVRLRLKNLLRHAHSDPLCHLDLISPDGYMQHIISIRHPRNGGYLSKSAYGSKRAALFHLFRMHNKIGYSAEFRVELGNLFRGFFRTLALKRQQPEDNALPELGPEARHGSREGKEPMSTDLYKAVAGWLLDFGTIDGVFAHCFLTLTWSLSCRTNNTASILMSDISWATCFDAFEVFFAHSKTDQVGDDAKYPRHIFANPHIPLICPVLSLAMYLSCCFNAPIVPNSPLFPGNRQETRFASVLTRVLATHQDDLRRLGYNVKDLGTHSIRKGAASYLSSLPSGPSPTSICIRGGWTMGRVRDIYMRYISAGDQFVGRCLSLLPILAMEFACSPPFFTTVAGSEDDHWVEESINVQFPMARAIVGFGRLLRMGLASILYHRAWIVERMNVNHIVRVSSAVLRSVTTMEKLESVPNLIEVRYPWNDRVHAFSGIPPYVGILQDLALVRNDQRELIDNFVSQVKEALRQYGINGNHMAEQRIQELLNQFQRELDGRLERVGLPQGGANQVERVETGQGYRLHVYGGVMHRVPADWRFPRCGVLDLWRQWWIGDTVRNIHPLRFLKIEDVQHLDRIPLDETEQHGRVGRHQRRAAKRTLCDLRFLMNWISKKVEDVGAREEVITLSAVNRMFQAVSHFFSEAERDGQKSWVTVVRAVRVRG